MKITRYEAVDGGLTYAIQINELVDIHQTRELMERLPEKIAELLAEHYVSAYKDEILKTINQKLIDGKVIAKIISKLKEGK